MKSGVFQKISWTKSNICILFNKCWPSPLHVQQYSIPSLRAGHHPGMAPQPTGIRGQAAKNWGRGAAGCSDSDGVRPQLELGHCSRWRTSLVPGVRPLCPGLLISTLVLGWNGIFVIWIMLTKHWDFNAIVQSSPLLFISNLWQKSKSIV